MPAIAAQRDMTSSCAPPVAERGASYLLVKFQNAASHASDETPLAIVLWSVLEMHFTHQLVLDMQGTACLDETAVKQLMTLAQWIVARRGSIRLCGLSEHDQNVLDQSGALSYLPVYEDVAEAIFAGHPSRLPR